MEENREVTLTEFLKEAPEAVVTRADMFIIVDGLISAFESRLGEFEESVGTTGVLISTLSHILLKAGLTTPEELDSISQKVLEDMRKQALQELEAEEWEEE